MLDLGWSEILIIGAVALIVIGPKELPNALKTFAYWMKQARKMAREFHSGVDDMIRQAELDDAKKAVEDARRNIGKQIENSVDPTGDVKRTLSDNPMKPATPSIPVSPSAPASAASAGTTAAPTPTPPAVPVEPPAAEKKSA
jgi:sec-independent protein translocase protein TatB